MQEQLEKVHSQIVEIHKSEEKIFPILSWTTRFEEKETAILIPEKMLDVVDYAIETDEFAKHQSVLSECTVYKIKTFNHNGEIELLHRYDDSSSFYGYCIVAEDPNEETEYMMEKVRNILLDALRQLEYEFTFKIKY